ncbi:MAG: MgtC/SapB family protein [Thermoprotei archaeon]|nr:MgtC/SapB family protein [Thermoprotei archaeon]
MPELELTSYELLFRFVVGFTAAALIGLEREKYRVNKGKDNRKAWISAPGVRSFGLIGLMGTFTTIIPLMMNYEYLCIPLSIIFMVISVIIIGSYTLYRFVVLKESGITTSIALGIAYATGIMSGAGFLLEAVAIAVLTTLVLAVKVYIEKILRGVTYKELISALEIGVLAFLIGPFVPRGYDPLFHIINLRMLYLFLVIILTISYISYMLLKAVGPNFIEYVAVLGGLVHSEATTVTIVNLYNKKCIGGTTALRALIAIISAMIFRNMILVLALISSIVRGRIDFDVYWKVSFKFIVKSF